MSTTSKDDGHTLLEQLTEQKAALDVKIKEAKDALLSGLHSKLKDAHALVQSLTEQISSHSDKPVPAKRGRKPGSKIKAAKTGTVKKRKGKRGGVGEAILKYLSTKGKAGAHVKDIAAATGNKPANVTAFFYAGKGKTLCKNVGPATFALKK